MFGAYATGVTQQEFESAASVSSLASELILPALEADPQSRDLFESLISDFTGGPRPFRDEGFEEWFGTNFFFADLLVLETGVFDNTSFIYPASTISANELNTGVERITSKPGVRDIQPDYSSSHVHYLIRRPWLEHRLLPGRL